MRKSIYYIHILIVLCSVFISAGFQCQSVSLSERNAALSANLSKEEQVLLDWYIGLSQQQCMNPQAVLASARSYNIPEGMSKLLGSFEASDRVECLGQLARLENDGRIWIYMTQRASGKAAAFKQFMSCIAGQEGYYSFRNESASVLVKHGFGCAEAHFPDWRTSM